MKTLMKTTLVTYFAIIGCAVGATIATHLVDISEIEQHAYRFAAAVVVATASFIMIAVYRDMGKAQAASRRMWDTVAACSDVVESFAGLEPEEAKEWRRAYMKIIEQEKEH